MEIFSRFLNCTNGTKSHRASHVLQNVTMTTKQSSKTITCTFFKTVWTFEQSSFSYILLYKFHISQFFYKQKNR